MPKQSEFAKSQSEIVVRDDIRITDVDHPVNGREIAVAYSSPLGGAGIYLTRMDALSLAQALFNKAMARL